MMAPLRVLQNKAKLIPADKKMPQHRKYNNLGWEVTIKWHELQHFILNLDWMALKS